MVRFSMKKFVIILALILISEKVWKLLKSENGKPLGPISIEGLKQKMEIFMKL